MNAQVKLWPGWLRRREPWQLLLLLLLGVISWFAFAPVHFDDGGLPLDKGRHLAAFAVLTWVSLAAFGGRGRGRPSLTVWVVLAMLGYGLLIELVQSQLPGREASGWDLLADAVGIAIGLAVARWISPPAT